MSITCSCIISLQRHVKTSYWQITVWQPFPSADSRSDCFYCSLSFVITGFSLRGIKQVWWHWRSCVFVWIWKKKKIVDVIFSPACETCQQIPLVAAYPAFSPGVRRVWRHAAAMIGASLWHLEIQCETMAAACDLLCFTLFSHFEMYKSVEQNSWF